MKTVLIVDDDPAIRDVIGDAMAEEGFGVSFAHSGRTTLQQLQTAQPDLVILDVVIPDGDGLGTLREMRARPNLVDTPVILVSTGETWRYAEYGVVTSLTKPFDLDHLVQLVVEAIGAPDDV